MKVRYRILKFTFKSAKSIYIAQYRFLGFWMNIDSINVGRFRKSSNTYCEAHDIAHHRIRVNKENIKRAKSWHTKRIVIAWIDEWND
jgi:hypothetical protein